MIPDYERAIDECLRHYSIATKERDEALEMCKALQQALLDTLLAHEDGGLSKLEASVTWSTHDRAAEFLAKHEDV